MNKGVLMAVALDEFSLENVTEKGQQKTKATIRVSFPGGYSAGQNGQQGKREYCRLRCTTSSPYMIEKLMALGIPQGRVPQGQQFYLTIPYKNMYWTLWNGNSGPGVTGYAEIDGDVLWTQPAPKPQNNQNGGFQNNGHQNNGGFQNPNQGGFQSQPQPGFQPHPGNFPGQPQPGFQPQSGFQNGGGAPNFPAANPPGFGGGQPQPGFQPQPQPGNFQPQQPNFAQTGFQPQGNFPGQPAPMGGPAQPAPFPAGQPFPQQQQGGFPAVAGSDPYTA